MLDYPPITIVTPSFNQTIYLVKPIKSILEQEYPNLEYNVIDSGSTDATVDIIRRYEDKMSY